MTFPRKAMSRPLFLGFSASLLALTLAACQTDAPPPPPPPPPAPAGPPVSLSPMVSDAASIYVGYVNSAKAMTVDFSDGAMVQTKLQQGAAFEPKQLGRGAIAYAAIIAMQEPAYRSQLRAYATDDAGRRAMVQQLIANPAYAATLPGANIAARRVILALSSDGEALYTKGAAIKQNAYSIQKEKWSKDIVKDPANRLAATKMSSSTTQGAISNESSRLLVAALTGEGLITNVSTGGLSGERSLDDPTQAVKTLSATETSKVGFDRETLFNTPYTHGVNRALAIAAISILGEGTGTNEESISLLLNDGASPRCLGESKLNLNQCLAASRFHFDDVFCIGQHILMDTGNCVGELSSPALDLAPKRQTTFNADGSEALRYANAKPYIKPAPVKKAVAKKTAAKTTAKKKN